MCCPTVARRLGEGCKRVADQHRRTTVPLIATPISRIPRSSVRTHRSATLTTIPRRRGRRLRLPRSGHARGYCWCAWIAGPGGAGPPRHVARCRAVVPRGRLRSAVVASCAHPVDQRRRAREHGPAGTSRRVGGCRQLRPSPTGVSRRHQDLGRQLVAYFRTPDRARAAAGPRPPFVATTTGRPTDLPTTSTTCSRCAGRRRRRHRRAHALDDRRAAAARLLALDLVPAATATARS